VSAPVRVSFLFASRGIGGAERSMLRLMARAHPDVLSCRLVVPARENPTLRAAADAIRVPYHALPPGDLLALRDLLRSQPPDLVYLFGRFRTIPWAIVARLAGVRCVVAAERSAANRWSDRLARRIDRYLVTAYVANSEFAARNLRAIVGEQPPVWVVPNGVADPTAWHEPALPAAARSLLCVGNITANKGQGVLLEAVRLLRPRHPGIRATLVGRDFTNGRFSRAARARGLGDTFAAVGFVDDVRPFLARADIVVLPTLEREGMPTALLEAMRAGVAVVASRVGGVSEIVQDGRTGLLVLPGDAPGLAAAIDSLLVDDVLRRRVAEAARAYALERHDLSVMVEGHRAAFGNALRRSGASGAAAGRAERPEASARVAHVTTVAGSLRHLLLGQLCTLRDHGYEVTGVSSPGPEASALASRGIGHVAVPMTRRLTPLADVRSLLRLYRVMRRGRFTIVHTHTPKPGLLAQVAARLARVPVVVNTIHGFYFHDRMPRAARRFYVALERVAGRCSDLILSQNEEDVATALRERIAAPGQIRHLGNGIDLQRFDPARFDAPARVRTRAALGISAEAPVVGFVGRLVAEKGVRELLEAARIVRRSHPGVRFLLVGHTDHEKADRVSPEAARELDGEGTCVFAGFREDMPELYLAMDVFVLPSQREGFPRAPMEASAMKVPCVVTDVRGCRQAVRAGDNGLLVPVGDARALAEAICGLLDDRSLARRLGEQGRRRAIEEFDERRVFAIVLSEYERLLGAKGLQPRVPLAPVAPGMMGRPQVAGG
jgi:glycosyltransferase involved in cell wall biosynthesis